MRESFENFINARQNKPAEYIGNFPNFDFPFLYIKLYPQNIDQEPIKLFKKKIFSFVS